MVSEYKKYETFKCNTKEYTFPQRNILLRYAQYTLQVHNSRLTDEHNFLFLPSNSILCKLCAKKNCLLFLVNLIMVSRIHSSNFCSSAKNQM